MVNSDPSRDLEASLTSGDLGVINAALELVKDLTSAEEARSEAIESRATNLLGFAGIIAALTVELTTFVTAAKAKNLCLSILLGLLYVAMLACLFRTTWLSIGIRHRRNIARPHVDDVVRNQKETEADFKRKWLAALIISYKRNTKEVNDRLTMIYDAQRWLTGATSVLLVIGALGTALLLLP